MHSEEGDISAKHVKHAKRRHDQISIRAIFKNSFLIWKTKKLVSMHGLSVISHNFFGLLQRSSCGDGGAVILKECYDAPLGAAGSIPFLVSICVRPTLAGKRGESSRG